MVQLLFGTLDELSIPQSTPVGRLGWIFQVIRGMPRNLADSQEIMHAALLHLDPMTKFAHVKPLSFISLLMLLLLLSASRKPLKRSAFSGSFLRRPREYLRLNFTFMNG